MESSHPAAGLYIHIPFCVRKCLYCDFYSISNTSSLKELYVTALLKEMALRKEKDLVFDTLYLGGGTPSSLFPSDIRRIIESAFRKFSFLKDTEITIEVNPGTVNSDTFHDYRDMGINRLNIGVQSFCDNHLTFLGRIHSEKEANAAIQAARDAGFENLGIDLIFGLPGQTKSQWLEDLEKGLSFQPEHFSCYMLTYENGTPLEKKMASGMFSPLPDHDVGELFQTTISFLEDHGYLHYEVSNYAIRDSSGTASKTMSRHNCKYWQMTPYLGFGPSAHSFYKGKRYWNVADVRRYMDILDNGLPPVSETEVLTKEQQMIEMIYLGLRTKQGIDTLAFTRLFHMDFHVFFRDILHFYEREGYLIRSGTRCALTRKGFLFLDAISEKFIDRL